MRTRYSNIPYWRRWSFWLRFLAAEVFAYVLSCAFTIVVVLLPAALFRNEGLMRDWGMFVFVPTLLYLTYDAFRFARSRSPRLLPARGFDVIFTKPAPTE